MGSSRFETGKVAETGRNRITNITNKNIYIYYIYILYYYVHVKFVFKVILGGDSAAIGVDGDRVADGTHHARIIQGHFFTQQGKSGKIQGI